MIKRLNKIMAFFFSFVIISYSVFASTDTYTRDKEDNYGVDPSHYEITSRNEKNVMNTPYIDNTEKVYDFAELLTDSEEKELVNLIDDYIEEYNMDMAIVTTNDTDFRNSQEYADDFYDYNNFGIGSTWDGLLFLIDMDNRQMYITTTGEAIRIYNDNRINSILDRTYTYIAKQDYYNCAKSFVTATTSYAKSGIPKENTNSHINSSTGNIVYDDVGSLVRALVNLGHSMLFGAIAGGIITLIFILVANSKHKVVRKATQAKQYLVNGSVSYSAKEDRFISTHTTRVYDPPSSSSSSSSSSSGGHSSTHSSSSGGSHGGGGRSF